MCQIGGIRWLALFREFGLRTWPWAAGFVSGYRASRQIGDVRRLALFRESSLRAWPLAAGFVSGYGMQRNEAASCATREGQRSIALHRSTRSSKADHQARPEGVATALPFTDCRVLRAEHARDGREIQKRNAGWGRLV